MHRTDVKWLFRFPIKECFLFNQHCFKPRTVISWMPLGGCLQLEESPNGRTVTVFRIYLRVASSSKVLVCRLIQSRLIYSPFRQLNEGPRFVDFIRPYLVIKDNTNIRHECQVVFGINALFDNHPIYVYLQSVNRKVSTILITYKYNHLHGSILIQGNVYLCINLVNRQSTHFLLGALLDGAYHEKTRKRSGPMGAGIHTRKPLIHHSFLARSTTNMKR